MISTPAPRASSTVQCGFGCVSGTPGDSTSDEKPLQSRLAQVADRNALLLGLGDAVGIVVPGKHLGAAFDQRARGRQPGPAEPEERDLLAVERACRDHLLLSAA